MKYKWKEIEVKKILKQEDDNILIQYWESSRKSIYWNGCLTTTTIAGFEKKWVNKSELTEVKE